MDFFQPIPIIANYLMIDTAKIKQLPENLEVASLGLGECFSEDP